MEDAGRGERWLPVPLAPLFEPPKAQAEEQLARRLELRRGGGSTEGRQAAPFAEVAKRSYALKDGMKRILMAGLAAVLFAVVFAVSSSPGVRSAAAAKTEGKVLFKGKTLLFKGGKCLRLTPSGRYQAVIGVLDSANPSKTRLLQITITRPAGGGTFKNPAAVVQWRIGTNLWVFNPGVVKLSADITKGTFSGQVTTGILATKVGAGSGSWTCSRIE